MFVLGDREQFKEQIVNHSKRAYQYTNPPLLSRKPVVGVDTEGSSGESDQYDLEANNNDNNGQEDLVVSDSLENI